MEHWHCMLSNEERTTLFPDEARMRAGVRAVVRVTAEELVAFNLVDSHIHLVLHGTRERVGRLMQAAGLALCVPACARLSAARIKPVNGRGHMEKLIGYVLAQDWHHGTYRHPALASGSFFQDLVGARVMDGFRLRLVNVLPRYRVRQAFQSVSLPPEPLEPADDERIRQVGPARLVEAAAAACCVGSELRARPSSERRKSESRRPHPFCTRAEKRARRCVSSLARKAGLQSADIGDLLGRSPRAIRHLAINGEDEAAERATRFRIALEDRVSALPRVGAESQVASM